MDIFEKFIHMVVAYRALDEAEPAFADRVKKQTELYKRMAISEPDSLRREIDRMHDELGEPPGFRDKVLELFSGVAWCCSEDFSFFPAARDFYHFIRRMVAESSPSVVHGLLSSVLQIDWRISRASMLEATRVDPSLGFERCTRTLAEVTRNAAERWYRPILACALEMSLRARGRDGSAVPGELGSLMAACRDSNDVPATIILERVGFSAMRSLTVSWSST